MKPLVVLFSTREGQTRKIAEWIVARLQARGLSAEALDLGTPLGLKDVSKYSAVFIAASVHGGRFAPELVEFLRKYRGKLARLRSAFISVSLTQASAADASAPPGRREEARAALTRMENDLFAKTGWSPDRKLSAAGALSYSKYGFLKRFIMKRIARSAGYETETSRDYEHTDFAELGRFVDEFVALAVGKALAPTPPAA